MIESPDMSLILARLDSLDRAIQGVNTSPWLTTQEAARYLRCSPRKVEQLTRLGLLPFHRQDSTSPRSPRLYHRRHLTAYLVAGRNPVKYRLSTAERREVAELL